MAELGIPFRLTEVDGVPCFWADAPGPATAGLLFRVGCADESLASSGLTHLVEHLALFELGRPRYDYNGNVDATTTSFYATGDPTELVAFVAHVCTAVRNLPAGRLEAEKRVLGIEEQRAEAGVLERMLMMRFGAAGHGLPFYEQMGLRRLGAEEVDAWARHWFTRGNAALWMTCPPPAGLRLPLPDGARIPPPDPQPAADLELPAYAASGTGGIASTMVSRRSSAIGVASRTVADRAHSVLRLERGLSYDVAAWQFPLTGELTHRLLSVDCMDEHAGEVLEALVGIYDSVAADGPTRDELTEACEGSIRALCEDEAVPGGLDYMAVDELLGAPKLWKEDLAREARAVSYAEAAAALREAMTTQLVIGPAGAANPSGRLNDFPWFSHDRVSGLDLRPPRGGRRRSRPAVRLIVGQEGVSHVSDDTDRATTVRFGQLAAALQEPDGSLTLIGRDGAIVPLDPHAFKGAGQVVADLERRLAPELLIPPRDTLSDRAPGVEQVARRKLRQRWMVDPELKLLHDRLDHHENLVTMAEATIGFNHGLLALTDRRVVWLYQGDTEPIVRELPYSDVHGVKLSRVPSHVVTLQSPAGETAFSRITPKERGPEIVEEIQRRVAVARAPQ